MKVRAPKEKHIQTAVTKLLRTLGFAVYSLSQARPTKQSFGLPDLIAFGKGRTLFIEMKRPGNKPTEWQLNFGANVADAEGSWVVWYSVDDAKAWLREHGNVRILA